MKRNGKYETPKESAVLFPLRMAEAIAKGYFVTKGKGQHTSGNCDDMLFNGREWSTISNPNQWYIAHKEVVFSHGLTFGCTTKREAWEWIFCHLHA